jgi:hypothetical protein
VRAIATNLTAGMRMAHVWREYQNETHPS